MFETRSAGYSRAFYLVAVLTWTAAVALLFMTAVWGGLYGMMDAMMSARESKQLAQSLAEPPGNGQTFPVHVEPHPFDQPQAPKTPEGWVVSEAEKGARALELRFQKLTQSDLGPDKPAAPPAPSNEVRQEIARPEPQPAPKPAPRQEPEGPPLMHNELGVITAVKYEPGTGRFLMTIQATATPEKYGFFYLDNPRRMVVNIPGAWRNTAPRTTDFATGPIARASIGEHPDYLRVTLHFRDPNAPKGPDPAFTRLKDALGVSLATK